MRERPLFVDAYYPGREWCELHWYKIRVDLITRRIIQKYEKKTPEDNTNNDQACIRKSQK
jgi:hypothetical protein